MAISFNQTVGLYEHALKLRAQRAEVLSSNLVNADTPNYKAQDFDFQQALQQSMSVNTQGFNAGSTHKGHFDLSGEVGASVDMQFRTPTQPSIDGNTVEEQLEHAEFMRNNLEFQSTFTLLNSRFKGLKSAIKGE